MILNICDVLHEPILWASWAVVWYLKPHVTFDAELPIKLWARAFTRELEFPATMAGYDELLGLLGEGDRFVPQSFAEMEGGTFVPRVAIVDPSRNWTMHVTSDSLNVECSPLPGRPINFETFCLEAAEQLGRILCAKEAKSHRLAVLWDRLLPTLRAEQLREAPGRFLKLPPMFHSDPFEWEWRAAVRVERNFGGARDLTNTLATVRRVEAKIQGQASDRLWLQTDVNTDPRRISARFSGDDARAFVQTAPNWHNEVTAVVVAQMEQKS